MWCLILRSGGRPCPGDHGSSNRSRILLCTRQTFDLQQAMGMVHPDNILTCKEGLNLLEELCSFDPDMLGGNTFIPNKHSRLAKQIRLILRVIVRVVWGFLPEHQI